MRKAMFAAMVSGLGLVNHVFAQDPDLDLKTKSSAHKGGEPTVFGEFFRSLDWYIWALLIILIALIGVFFYIRNKPADD